MPNARLSAALAQVYKALMHGVDEVAIKLIKVGQGLAAGTEGPALTHQQLLLCVLLLMCAFLCRATAPAVAGVTCSCMRCTRWRRCATATLCRCGGGRGARGRDSRAHTHMLSSATRSHTLVLHLRQFYGACLEPGSMFFVTEYMKVGRCCL